MFKHVIVIAIGAAYLLWAVPSYSFCVETNRGDGSLSPGIMPSNACQSLLNTLSQQSSQTYMFRVQKNTGYYGKVCNEDNQIKHFMATYAKPNGSWSCKQTSNPCSALEINGVFSLDVSGDSYRLCEWK